MLKNVKSLVNMELGKVPTLDEVAIVSLIFSIIRRMMKHEKACLGGRKCKLTGSGSPGNGRPTPLGESLGAPVLVCCSGPVQIDLCSAGCPSGAGGVGKHVWQG